ncbi:MAG: hypothetical protein LBM09_00865 [Candidatus Nomurabacteria bacterium]|jgi:hypothetical protein|nr:hypothetical protein [Candidatus Nomurabacteria bacterium]
MSEKISNNNQESNPNAESWKIDATKPSVDDNKNNSEKIDSASMDKYFSPEDRQAAFNATENMLKIANDNGEKHEPLTMEQVEKETAEFLNDKYVSKYLEKLNSENRKFHIGYDVAERFAVENFVNIPDNVYISDDELALDSMSTVEGGRLRFTIYLDDESLRSGDVRDMQESEYDLQKNNPDGLQYVAKKNIQKSIFDFYQRKEQGKADYNNGQALAVAIDQYPDVSEFDHEFYVTGLYVQGAQDTKDQRLALWSPKYSEDIKDSLPITVEKYAEANESKVDISSKAIARYRDNEDAKKNINNKIDELESEFTRVESWISETKDDINRYSYEYEENDRKYRHGDSYGYSDSQIEDFYYDAKLYKRKLEEAQDELTRLRSKREDIQNKIRDLNDSLEEVMYEINNFNELQRGK